MLNKILVTGGTGYIGSHTTVELINNGFEVVIVDNLSNSNIDVVDRIQAITGTRPGFEKFDLCDQQAIHSFFNKHQDIKGIIHFAASKAVGESVEKPLLYYRNNLVSLLNILEEMKEFSVENLIFSSSCTVYGEPDTLPITEQAPVKKANSPYGNTKQIAEEIIHDTIVAVPSIKSIALRYFNPVGAHPTALIGELPLGVPLNLVPFLTQTAIGIREELKVFGNDFDTPDGYGVRDYIHVVDLAKAHVIAMKRLIENKNKKSFEIFNIGTGKGSSVKEIIDTFEKVNQIKVNYKVVGRRAGDIAKIWADTTFANNELGWKSESTLEETLASAWKWEKNIRNKN